MCVSGESSFSLTVCQTRMGGYLLVFLQIQKGDRIPKTHKSILANDGDVVRAEIQMPETVQRAQRFARNDVEIIVPQAKIL